MKRQKISVNIENILATHRDRREEIIRTLETFAQIKQSANDRVFWEEMVFCFFTGGCSAKMGIKSLNAVKHLLESGTQEELANALVGSHRYPNARSKYIVASREFLTEHCGMKLNEKLHSFSDDLDRRDWLVREKGIKGLGYKEASHYLRNIGFKGYAILDKHILGCLAELKIIDDPKPPNTRLRYLMVEQRLKVFSKQVKIDFDEIDLVLWSMKTGEILK